LAVVKFVFVVMKFQSRRDEIRSRRGEIQSRRDEIRFRRHEIQSGRDETRFDRGAEGREPGSRRLEVAHYMRTKTVSNH
jgi:hypothetical protein